MVIRSAQSAQRHGVIGALDIGSSKICCLIAAPDANGEMALVGFGHQRSAGVKSGMIIDADAAERAVRATVAQAERMAGVHLQQVVVTVGCGRIQSQHFVARARVAGSLVTDHDLHRVITGGEAYIGRSGRTLVHLGRSSWCVDGAAGVRDPRGMAGREVSVELSAVTADEAPLRNLLAVIERCHLEVERMIPSPLASAYAVTNAEDRAGRVLVVDIGGGTTTFAAFAEGSIRCVEAIPVGGNHITYDIARALVTSLPEAERIKTLYGTMVKAASDASELISYPVQGEDGPVLYQTTRSQLRLIIEPRVERLLGLIEERLASCGCQDLASGRVMLTGGAGQMLGFDQAWMRRLSGDARISRPLPLLGMAAGMCGPALSGVIGLVRASVSSEASVIGGGASARQVGGYLGRMQRWLGEGF